MKTPIFLYVLPLALLLQACSQQSQTANYPQGKTERESISVVGKLPGRIQKLNVKEGDLVQKGDTLAILDAPEVAAKMAQAQGAVKSASAQYEMSVRGAST